ncbi:MAG: hypothetical protein AB7O24_12830 [Kofleriaceae bacterium]
MSDADAAERPLADPSREQDARDQFEPLTRSPEEYAARFAHLWAMFSFDSYRYRDPVLDRWIQRFSAIVRDQRLLDECRKTFLTDDEQRRIAEELASDDPF